MRIEGSVVFVSGANRGLGEAYTRLLLANGAAKVYGGARDPGMITVPGVVPVQLDITSMTDVEAAPAVAGDVTLLVNNAGISTRTGIFATDALEQGRREMETNVFGPIAMSRVFAPRLAANGGGAIVNVLSVLSWLSMPTTAMYSAAKSRGVVVDQQPAGRVGASGNNGRRGARRVHRHRHGRWGGRPEGDA